MKNKRLYLILIVLCLTESYGQDFPFKDPMVYRVLNECNNQYSRIQKGKFDIVYLMKYMNREDTSKYYGTCFFDKTETDKDSIAKFCIFSNNTFLFLYDHVNFHELNISDSAIIYSDMIETKLQDVTKGSIKYKMIPYQLLKMKNIITLNKYYEAEYAGLENYNEELCFKIIRYEHNEVQKVNNKITLLIDAKDYFIKKYTDELHYQNMHQYSEYVFADYEEIHDEFNNLCNMDDLIKKYHFKKNQKTKKKEEAVTFDKLNYKIDLPEIITLQGDTFNIKNVNSEMILLDFWYTGCLPCILSLPFLKKIEESFNEEKLTILGINSIDKDIKAINKFIEKYDIDYKILLDPEKKWNETLGVKLYPTCILIDVSKKRIIDVEEGFSEESYNNMYERIQKYLE